MSYIIYVDDDEDDRTFFKDALQSLNKNIVLKMFSNGNELIHFLRTINSKEQLPCYIISDMKMPLMNGIELLGLLKAEPIWQDIPVTIFSTSSALIDSNVSALNGAASFFSKPSTFEELRTVIAEMLHSCSQRISDTASRTRVTK